MEPSILAGLVLSVLLLGYLAYAMARPDKFEGPAMKPQDIAEIVIFIGTVVVASPFLGSYMARVYSGEIRFLGRIERFFYRATGIDPSEGMGWKKYALALLSFSLASFVLLFLILVSQGLLPLNPQKMPGLRWDLALNTTISFVTNTNWQAYSGEASLSYLSQALGLTVQNFLSAAAGMAVAVAVVRGIAHRANGSAGGVGDGAGMSVPSLGNFWVDMTRSVLYVLLPLSILLAIILASQGVVQSLSGYVPALSLEGKSDLVPLGPAASQVAIKQLGTNGGGFFGPNSAFPFENPTPLTNLLELISILLIPAAFPFLFGAMVGKRRQGTVIFAVMLVLYLAVTVFALAAESRWGTMEGKETRVGAVPSVLWAVATTVASNGSVNAMHDSLSPLGGMVPLLDIMLGEVIFGGVGAGLYGMLALVLITVFIAGLMVGRSPEYLGKKIEAREVQLAMLAIIAPNLIILAFSALAITLPVGLAGLANRGPHGLSEILFAYSSGAGNNGSAFAGLAVNTPFYNLTIGAAMLIGRFGVMLPMLGAAGSLAAKKPVAGGSGSFRTDTGTFGVLLLSVVVIVAGLTHFPALTLGPILDHFLMTLGVSL